MLLDYGTVQYSTVQYSTVQYSTVQYSTVQYSTASICKNKFRNFVDHLYFEQALGHYEHVWLLHH